MVRVRGDDERITRARLEIGRRHVDKRLGRINLQLRIIDGRAHDRLGEIRGAIRRLDDGERDVAVCCLARQIEADLR